MRQRGTAGGSSADVDHAGHEVKLPVTRKVPALTWVGPV